MADLSRQELHRLARVGAEARLRELEQERATLLRTFPDLRGARAPISRKGATKAAATEGPRTRGRRKMSAAARKAVSERMKKYWAARRATRSKSATAR